MKKITTLFSACVFITGISFAQINPVWNVQYQHTTSPGFSNEARRIAEDVNGNIFTMADVTSDIDQFGVHGVGTWNYTVITKYSPNGVLLATVNVNIQKHIYSGFDNLGAFGLALDAAGNVYAGYITWNGITNFDVALAKYNNNLTRLWTNTYGGNGDEVGVDMKLHPNGTIYAVVKSTNGTTQYSIIQSVASSSPALLVYSYAPNSAVINSIALDGSSRAYVGGYTTKGGSKNAYVGCINLFLNTLAWNSGYSPTSFVGDDVINKVVVGIDGNVYSVGTSYQGVVNNNQVLVIRNLANNPHMDYIQVFGNPTINDVAVQVNASELNWLYVGAVAGLQVQVYRFPSNGIFSFPAKVTFGPAPAQAYNTLDAITLNSMVVATSKNIYVTGGVTATDNQGQFVSSYFEKASVVFGNVLQKMGGLTVEGSFNHNMEGVDLSLDYGKSDVYMIRSYWDDAHTDEKVEIIDISVPSPLRESISPKESIRFSISPNPANSRVSISSEEVMSSIEVIDLTGNQVLFMPAESNEMSLDISALANGVYFCKVKTLKGEMIKRLVVN